MCTNDIDQASSLSAIKPKIIYTEAIKYLEENERKILNNDREEIKINMFEDLHIEVKQDYINKIINNVYKLYSYFM